MNPPLFWHNEGRAPLVGYGDELPLIRENDPKQPEEFWWGFVYVFDLSKPDDLAAYNQVVETVAKGVSVLCREEVNFSSRTNNYIVYVRWAQRGYADPSKVFARANTNDRGQIVFNNQVGPQPGRI